MTRITGQFPIVIALLLLAASFPGCLGSSSADAPAPPPPVTLLVGTTGDDFGYDVVAGPSGDVFLAGLTTGSLDNNAFSGSQDLFLAKFGAGGGKEWIRQRGPAAARAVARDGSGNLYVAGSTGASLDGNPHAGGADVVVVKYDASGNRVWTSQFGTAGSDTANDIAVAPNGNVYVAGDTYGDLGGATNAGNGDAFLAKVDPADGTLVWVELVGTSSFEVGEGVATDNAGNVYVCGMTLRGNLEGFPDPPGPPGGEDVFVASFLDNGTSAVRNWLRQHGTDFDEYPVALGVSGGTLYIAGYTDGDLGGQGNQGGQDVFLWRMSAADGSSLGTTLIGSPERDFAEGLAIGADGSVYVAGRTNGDLGGPNADPSTDPSTSTFDYFLAKFSPDGTLAWKRQNGTTVEDGASGVAVDGAGTVSVAGTTAGNLGGARNSGGKDAFLVRYDGAGNRK